MNTFYPKRLATLLAVACAGFSLTANAQTYCTPICSTGCTVGGGDYIQSFSTTGGSTNITNNNTGCNGNTNNYIYYSTQTVTAPAGNTIAWSCTNCNNDPQGYMIWVDWNADGDFSDSLETVFASTAAISAGATISGTVTVPGWATTGTKRMRVRSSWNQTNFSPCASQWYGETEDYNFQVGTSTGCSGGPVAGTLSITPSATLCASTPATLVLTGNTPGAAYTWQMSSNGGTTWTNIGGATGTVYSLPVPITAAMYRVQVACGGTVATTNTITVTLSGGPCQDSVWPGDANYDLIANNMDALNVSVAYNVVGSARPGASSSWTAQFSADWPNNFYGGVNYKNADCNGDSIINNADLTVITANYGMTHPKGDEQNAAKVTGLPDLYFDLTGISLVPGTMVTVPLKLGTSGVPADKVYGLAATVKINGITPQVTPALSFTNGWLGTASNTLNLVKVLNNNTIDWAYARNDHHNTSGNGTLGTLTFDVPHGAGGTLTLHLQTVKMIDSSGNTLTGYNVVDATAGIQSSGISNVPIPGIADIAPNPSQGTAQLVVNVASVTQINVKITDLSGKSVWQTQATVDDRHFAVELPAAKIAAGVYLVQVTGLKEPKLIRWIKE